MFGLIFAFLTTGQDAEKELAPIAALLGSWEGEGEAPFGKYRDRTTYEWGIGKTCIICKVECKQGDVVVYEEWSAFSWDPGKKKIKYRLFSRGGFTCFEGEIKDGGKTVVFTQTEQEAAEKSEWRETFTIGDKEHSYTVDVKKGEKFEPFVKATLKKK